MTKQEIEDRTNDIKVQLGKMVTEIAKNERFLNEKDYKVLLDFRDKTLSTQSSFDAKKYFVVCLGAAKAGKSTLLNALAEREVSHASPSAETTLHCSIIMAADEEHPEGITLYSPQNNKFADDTAKDEKIEAHTRLLLEYFKGTKEWDDISSTFSRSAHTYQLNETDASRNTQISNLEYILTSHNLTNLKPHDDFFLAEIRVNVTNPENILKHDVALIDMPGLDGMTAGKDNNPILEYLPKFCHQFLLVQSSVTALNSVTRSVLQEILALKHDVPLWVVYNEIRGKEWHTPEAQDAAREKASECAEKELERLTRGMQNGVKTFCVNAVMAWESCETEYAKHRSDFRPEATPEYLREHSYIDSLKLPLCEQVVTQKHTTILKDALGACINLDNSFQEDGEFDNRIQELKKELSDLDAQNKVWDSCLRNMNTTCQNYETDSRSNIASSLSNDFRRLLTRKEDGSKPSLLETLKEVSVDFQFPATKGKEGKYTQEEQRDLIDNYLKAFTRKVYQVLSETPFAGMARRKLKGYTEKDPEAENVVHKGTLDYFTASLLTEVAKLSKEDAVKLESVVNAYLANLSFDEITKGHFKYPTIEEFYKTKEDKYNVPAKSFKEKYIPLYSRRSQKSMNDYFHDMKTEYIYFLENELQENICENFANAVTTNYLDSLKNLPQELDKVYQQWKATYYTKQYDYCEKFEKLLQVLKDDTATLKNNCEQFKLNL